MTDHIWDAAIIGAGYGGVGMGAQLARHGIDDYVVFERGDRVGGVWRENIYPGAACDTQSHIYCYSFFLNLRVSRMFAGRDELIDYLEALVDEFDVRRHIRFNTSVTSAVWDDAEAHWRLTSSDGSTTRARVLVPAWGQLSVPSIPDFPGRSDFRGKIFHSARWDYDVDLVDQRVASIGAAASAVQYVPEIAPVVRELQVFQRSANYILPRNQIIFTPTQLDEFASTPALFEQSRAEIHAFREASFQRARLDTSEHRAAAREAREHLENQVSDPELRRKLTPDYEYGCKRILRSDDYYPALTRPNVEVITERIEQITPTGIRTADGADRDVDVIIFGTGFRSQAFNNALEIVGRHGRTLDERWGDSPEAYLGMSVDGFPNMFMIYGPNTNLNHNSIVTMMEAQQKYIVQAIELIHDGMPRLDVKESVLREFNAVLQSDLSSTAYSSDCSSWYKNAAGKVINNWSGTVEEYEKLTQNADLSDFTRV
ncbi:flavin-containing monooxygenase [Rhodococcus opacus]|jgi:cation diffusion facilitator CzcD-associated flavoprotein CzcO|uniref:flavin-containing monooxygenase n=1 Tax=Rhodococcus opacus TaxID=37919 RepID=UPI0024757C68|nr:NAD(P)/FAD-dependent oxidoreductase [Rhodococcus opacus]MDH6293255.1 cation diffusion facilitator CzcD-associated flavoprotein CzcO [Rhodococcus opacus]